MGISLVYAKAANLGPGARARKGDSEGSGGSGSSEGSEGSGQC